MDELNAIFQNNASGRQVKIEFGKLKYMQRYCTKMIYCYTMYHDEERLFRIILVRNEKFDDYLKYEHPTVTRHEVVEPSLERWKFVMNHMDDDLGLDTHDHKTCEGAVREGLVFICLEQSLRI
jgi:hypothetical protein